MNNIKKIFLIIVIIFTIFVVGYPRSIDKFEKDINDEDILLADVENGPKLIEPYYNTNHFIVADYIVKPSNSDMTSTIQSALNKCKNVGGTVWLERGIYNVSSPIVIPNGCTLMGDWQDPDNYQGNLDYGTKIVVDVTKYKSDSSNYEETALFKMQASTGVEGLTIYYKNQKVNNPTPQPWTFEYNSGMLKTFKNITLINSYYGIGRNIAAKTAHEMLMIENVKGTILKKGVLIHNSSDVGTITGLYFSPSYLAKANLKAFGDNSINPSESTISSSVKANGGMGLIITDAEQSQFVNMKLSGFKYGIYIPDYNAVKTRYMGSGGFYNLNISNCDIGIMVESGVYEGKTLVDHRWGYLISNSSIEGSQYAIKTNSQKVGNRRGHIKLNEVSIKGKTGGEGAIIYNNSGDSYTSVPKETNLNGVINNNGKLSNLNLYRRLKNSGNNLKVLSSGSSIDTINSALSSISSAGGGVVYLKPGVYKVDKTINVPANVELRGSSSSPNRIFNYGTTLNVVNNVIAVKVNGNNSGISGINIIYEKNVNMLSTGTSYNTYEYSIVLERANNVYVKNVSIAAATHGIYVNECNNFSLENIVTGVLEYGIRVDNSSNGLILNTLQNGTVICRNNLFAISEGTANFNYIMNPTTKKKLRYIYLSGDNNIELQNNFTFGSYIFVTAINSKVYAVNSGYDGSVGIFYEATNSNVMLSNGLKMNGQTLKNNSSSVGIYNVATTDNVAEKDTHNASFKVSNKLNDASIRLSSKSVTLNSLSNKNISYEYVGDGKLTCKSSDDKVVKCSVNTTNKNLVISPVSNTVSPVTITISSNKGKYYDQTEAAITVVVNTGSSTGGDVDGNGKVGTSDYILIRKHLLGTTLKGDKLKRADVNSDGKITTKDFTTVRRIILGGNTSSCSANYSLSSGKCYDTAPPTINDWDKTNLTNTVINKSSATFKLCGLGKDSGDGLKTIEYYTDCTKTKTATISGDCATISISACKKSTLYYRLKDNNNYSNFNRVEEIGLYLIYAQVYNRILYPSSPAYNNANNLGYWARKIPNIPSNIINIGNNIIKERAKDNNTAFVKSLYRAVQGREGEADGVNYWVNNLNKGTSRIDVISSFVNSSEAKGIYSAWGY